MSNIIDLTERLASRKTNSEFTSLGVSKRNAVEGFLLGTSWSRLFSGVTRMGPVSEWSDLKWASIDLQVTSTEPKENDTLFNFVFAFHTDFRRLYIPEFGNQSHTNFLNVAGTIEHTVVKGPGIDDDLKMDIKQGLVDYVSSFPQIDTTLFALQIGFLVNLLDNNTVHYKSAVRTNDGKLSVSLSIPADDPGIGARMLLTITFDFLPLILDYMAIQLASEPVEQW